MCIRDRARWGGQGEADGLFQGPTGIAVDSTNHWIYVSDPGNRRVQKFNRSEDLLAILGGS